MNSRPQRVSVLPLSKHWAHRDTGKQVGLQLRLFISAQHWVEAGAISVWGSVELILRRQACLCRSGGLISFIGELIAQQQGCSFPATQERMGRWCSTTCHSALGESTVVCFTYCITQPGFSSCGIPLSFGMKEGWIQCQRDWIGTVPSCVRPVVWQAWHVVGPAPVFTPPGSERRQLSRCPGPFT